MAQDKVEYLHLIQEPICRMSTISAVYKGFSATIVAGISAISYPDVSLGVLSLSCIPIISFALLDLYYLKLERKYRYLFEQVRTDKHEIDFSMKLTNDPIEIISAKARTIDCIKSPSIYLFYPLVFMVLITVIILKTKGVV